MEEVPAATGRSSSRSSSTPTSARRSGGTTPSTSSPDASAPRGRPTGRRAARRRHRPPRTECPGAGRGRRTGAHVAARSARPGEAPARVRAAARRSWTPATWTSTRRARAPEVALAAAEAEAYAGDRPRRGGAPAPPTALTGAWATDGRSVSATPPPIAAHPPSVRSGRRAQAGDRDGGPDAEPAPTARLALLAGPGPAAPPPPADRPRRSGAPGRGLPRVLPRPRGSSPRPRPDCWRRRRAPGEFRARRPAARPSSARWRRSCSPVRVRTLRPASWPGACPSRATRGRTTACTSSTCPPGRSSCSPCASSPTSPTTAAGSPCSTRWRRSSRASWCGRSPRRGSTRKSCTGIWTAPSPVTRPDAGFADWVWGETGTVFLDVDDEAEGEVAWTREHVAESSPPSGGAPAPCWTASPPSSAGWGTTRPAGSPASWTRRWAATPTCATSARGNLYACELTPDGLRTRTARPRPEDALRDLREMTPLYRPPRPGGVPPARRAGPGPLGAGGAGGRLALPAGDPGRRRRRGRPPPAAAPDFHQKSVVVHDYGAGVVRTRLVAALDVAHALARKPT